MGPCARLGVLRHLVGRRAQGLQQHAQGQEVLEVGGPCVHPVGVLPAGRSPGGQKLSINLTQVVADTKYDVKVRAANATTATPWTETLVGKTGSAIGKPEITFMRIESSSSIYVDWTYASAAMLLNCNIARRALPIGHLDCLVPPKTTMSRSTLALRGTRRPTTRRISSGHFPRDIRNEL